MNCKEASASAEILNTENTGNYWCSVICAQIRQFTSSLGVLAKHWSNRTWPNNKYYFAQSKKVSIILCWSRFVVSHFNLYPQIDLVVNSSSCVLDWKRVFKTGNMSMCLEGKKESLNDIEDWDKTKA